MKKPGYMVGDIVNINGHPQEIAAVHQKKVGYHRRDDRLEWARLDRVTGISVTSDFLLRNSFIKEDVSRYTFRRTAGDGSFRITLEDKDDGIWGISIRDIDNNMESETFKEVEAVFLKVHQLQHEFECLEINKDWTK